MNAGVYPGLSADLLGRADAVNGRIRWMLGLSLLLHVGLVLVLAGLRISKVERPLASYQVSLVTLPTPQAEAPATPIKPVEQSETKPIEPPVTKPTPTVQNDKPVHLPPPPQVRPTPRVPTPPMESKPKLDRSAPPMPTVKPRPDPVPAPAPPAPSPQPSEAKAPPPPAPPPSRPALNREVLKGFSLPEVPKLSEVKPAPSGAPKETVRQTEEEVQKLLKNLNVPEPTVERPRSSVDPPRQPVAPAVSEELTSQLQKLKQQAAIPPPPPPARAAQRTEPVVAAKPPAMKMPVTTLQLPGLSQGNPYLAAIQKRISSQWIAPPVDANGIPLQVIIKFRLERTGEVKNVTVEQSSGNEYYDLAAKRAVVAANPLPTFPQDLTLPYLDAHFSFSVGEPVS